MLAGFDQMMRIGGLTGKVVAAEGDDHVDQIPEPAGHDV